MKKSLSALFWTLVFLVLLLGIDQLFLRIPASISPHREAQTFYLDFRTRLLASTLREQAEDRQQAAPGKEQSTEKPPAQVPAAAPAASALAPGGEGAALRYIYVDKAGTLHFADSLQDIPAAYRAEARPMSR